MQKLIMKSYSSDEYTCYMNVEYTPFLGESPKTVAVLFNAARVKANGRMFKFLGIRFDENEIRITKEPDFLTVDEWFKDCKWC